MKQFTKNIVLIGLIATLGASAAFAGRDGGGGNTSAYTADDSAIEEALSRAPILYKHILKMAFNSEFESDVFANKKNKEIIENKLKSIKLDIRTDKPCFYPGDRALYEGSAYNDTVCLSRSQIMTKKHSVAEIQSKVVGLFAHEMRHIFGAGHDQEGERQAESEQMTFEALAKLLDLDNGYANIKHVTGPGDQCQTSIENLANEYTRASKYSRAMSAGLVLGSLGRFQDALNYIVMTYPAVSNLSRMKLMAIYMRVVELFFFDSGDIEAIAFNKKIFGNKKSLSLAEYFKISNQLEGDNSDSDELQFTSDDLAGIDDIVVYNGMLLNDAEKQRELSNINKDFKALLSAIKTELATFAQELNLH